MPVDFFLMFVKVGKAYQRKYAVILQKDIGTFSMMAL